MRSYSISDKTQVNIDEKYNYYLKKYCTIKLDREKIFELLKTKADSVQKQILEYQLRKLPF